MVKYQVGIEFTPNGDTQSTCGLIGGREIQKVRSKVKLNKKTNSYYHIKFDQNDQIIEIRKLTKKEYNNLHCGFGQMNDFADFLKDVKLI